MRILQLCNKPPYPPHEGGSLAMHNITIGLINAGCQVDVLAMSSYKNTVDINKLPEEYLTKTNFSTVFVDLRLKILPALYCFFFFKSYHAFRFNSYDFSKKIEEILSKNKYDIIFCETVFMAHFVEKLRNISKAKIVLRSHNVEHLIWYRIAKETFNPIKKFYLYHLAFTLKKFEFNSLKKFDFIASISKRDTEILKQKGCRTKIVDIPFGINLTIYKFETKNIPLDFYHLGAMNWLPNQKGIIWFIENVWSVFIKSNNFNFYLAGRNMFENLKKIKVKGVQVVGEVQNAIDFMSNHKVMVVPIFSGSGIRVKIIEALALSKIIITTSVGAEGINCTHKKDIFIANTISEFLDAMNFIAKSDIQTLESISINARKLAETEHNSSVIIKNLIQVFKDE